MEKAILRKRRLATSIAASAYCLFGFLSALLLAREPSGYLASFGFIMLVFLWGGVIILLCIVGIVMLIVPELRWCAPALLLSCVLIPGSYFVSLKTMSYLGLVRYEHEQMVPVSK